MLKKYLLFFILILCQISGCATVQTGLDRQENIFITTPQEVAIGEKVIQQIEKENKILNNPVLTGYVNKVGQKLAEVCFRRDIDYHFKIIDSEMINAFALPGGFIYVYGGALAAMDNEAQLAAVLAHEMGHVAARHGVKQLQKAQIYGALSSILLKDEKKAIAELSNMAANLVFLGYSREAEFEADKLGVHFAVQAGYDPKGMLEFFDKLKQKEKKEPGKLEVLLRTHPSTSERIGKIESQITVIEKQDLIRNEAEFKAMIKRLEERY
ncbi:MAG: M48 family metallopeptidase [bacterium]|nr:M48 family metallopeptidase [bacterium]